MTLALRWLGLSSILVFALGTGCSGSSPTDGAMQDGSDAATTHDNGTDGIGPDATLPPGHTAILTYGGTIQRTLATTTEAQLTVVAVMTAGRFGRDPAFNPTLDGELWTAPLYLPQLTVAGASHDVLYVATQQNTVFALDAATGATLWQTSVGTPVPTSAQPCGVLNPTGVQGGMAIDLGSQTLYAVSAVLGTGNAVGYAINALDVTTGTQRSGYPQPILPPASNGSTWPTDPTNPQGERGAITVVNGTIYVPFGGLNGDCYSQYNKGRGGASHTAGQPYHGWVVGIDPANPTHQGAFATSGGMSGIWAPGGISSDGTNLYAATGNGNATPGVYPSPMGEWVLAFPASGINVTQVPGNAGYFTPSDRRALDSGDTDIGSNGPVVLPDIPGASTPHLLFQGGKAGVGYLLNRDNLGGAVAAGSTEGLFSATYSGGLYGAAAAWSSGTVVTVFAPIRGNRPAPCSAGTGGVAALQINVTGGVPSFAPVWCSGSSVGQYPEGSPGVSSNGNLDGILWVTQSNGGNLSAYQVSTGTRIFNDATAGTVRNWVPPVIADGRVFVTDTRTVTMYRLLH